MVVLEFLTVFTILGVVVMTGVLFFLGFTTIDSLTDSEDKDKK